MHDVFGLESEVGALVLRWLQPEVTPAATAWTQALLERVSPRLETVRSPMRTADGRSYSVHDGRLVHIPTNFQATNHVERAVAIAEMSGLISIKGHIIKNAMGHIAVDGIDGVYCNYLDLLFTTLEERFGDELWWASCGQIAAQAMAASPGAPGES